MKFLLKVLALLRRCVAAITGFVFAWMILLALLQVIFRWAEWSGMEWADNHLRQLLLWLALLGGVLAASDSRHIRIDLLEHYLKPGVLALVGRIVNALAGCMALYLGVQAIRFVANERESGLIVERVFFGAPVPIWWIELAIPVGMFLIALFFIAQSIVGAATERIEK